jgi:hypothetical protein
MGHAICFLDNRTFKQLLDRNPDNFGWWCRVFDVIIPLWLKYSTLYFFNCFLFETYHIKSHDLIYLASFRNPGFRQQNSRYRQVKGSKPIIGLIHHGQCFLRTMIRRQGLSQSGIIKSGTLMSGKLLLIQDITISIGLCLEFNHLTLILVSWCMRLSKI